jgi:hypothetical protein
MSSLLDCLYVNVKRTVASKRRSTQHSIPENLKCQQHRCQNPKSRTSSVVFHDLRMTRPWTVTPHRQGIPQRADNSWATQTYTFIITAFHAPKTSDLLGPWTKKLPLSTMLRIRKCICRSNLLRTLLVRAWLFPLSWNEITETRNGGLWEN